MVSIRRLLVSEIGCRTFLIPPYQRGYRWSDKDVKLLLQDLIHFLHADNEHKYCLQPIVLQKDSNGHDLVVDGQQRLTTLLIVLAVLCDFRMSDIPWDIEYTVENRSKLKNLLASPGSSINDYFRNKVREYVSTWVGENRSDAGELRELILAGTYKGNQKKELFFIEYFIDEAEDGQQAFNRINAGKTPLTSSELLRARFMVSDSGLPSAEVYEIAKEWELINSTLENSQFWAIWNTRRMPTSPTKMDLLFAIVAKHKFDKNAKYEDSLAVFHSFEKYIDEQDICNNMNGKSISEGLRLRRAWEKLLRCWWWMRSCYDDLELYHLLGWIAIFTEHQVYVLYNTYWIEKAKCNINAFKKILRGMVRESLIADCPSFDSYTYILGAAKLRPFFVLINSLVAIKRHDRFRFDLYAQGGWDIEHIASQTDNPLDNVEDQKQWLELAKREMSEAEKSEFENTVGDKFDDQWRVIWRRFADVNDSVQDKDGLGNLALLDYKTNRAYKNAIFPAKRRKIFEVREETARYVPPATELAFAKSFTASAAQMRYWGESDAVEYRNTLQKLYSDFMKGE